MSPRQQEALDAAKANGGKLYRWPGAWWSTTKYTPYFDSRKKIVPQPAFSDLIILALLKRKLVQVEEKLPRGDPAVISVVP